MCEWLWYGNESFHAAGGDQGPAEHQVFQCTLSRYMWQILCSQSCMEKLLLTGREGTSETRLQSKKWAGRWESLSFGIQLQIWAPGSGGVPSTTIFVPVLETKDVNTPLLASPLWIFRWLQPANLPSASPRNCSGWGGIPWLSDTCSAAHLWTMGRTPRSLQC